MEIENKGRTENVKVYIRIKPLNDDEFKSQIIEINKENSIIRLIKEDNKEFEQFFIFHEIFTEETSQLEMYHKVASPIVETILNGFNGTIFAYGQTGSGKTYTMVGDHTSPDLQGIIPNSFSQIFGQISRSANYKSFVVTVTFLEIYNEELRDLFKPNLNKKLTIHEHNSYGSFVRGISVFTVKTKDEMKKLFIRGNKNRTTKSNAINQTSSRSHAIFTIMVESKNHQTNEVTFGKLNFVDLAGSERLNRTKATGDMLKEGSHINLSLSVLGNVISTLVERKSSHIPYRNSKLTRLLKDSLGGNSKTAMIANLSLADVDYDESLCTLRYASKVRYIENYISPNTKEEGIIGALEKQIGDLQDKVKILDEQQTIKQTQQYDLQIKTNEKKKIQEEIIVTENTKQDLLIKIEELKQKIIVGGVNLLDKVEEQNTLLKKSSNELIILQEKNQKLEEILDKKKSEKIQLTKNFELLQEEKDDLDKQLLRIQEHLEKYENLLKQQQIDQKYELERKLDDQKMYENDLVLSDFVLDSFIPKEYVGKIESNIRLNEDDNEYHINQLPYVGNNIDRKTNKEKKFMKTVPQKIKTPYIKSSKRSI